MRGPETRVCVRRLKNSKETIEDGARGRVKETRPERQGADPVGPWSPG